jgi:hypothetical protein
MSNNLVAKPIVKNQLWVITDGVNKIGNIEANSGQTGYNVKIGDNVNFFSTTKSIEKTVHLVFEKPVKPKKSFDLSFANWPTAGKTFNNFYDVKRKIHVYTKTQASKCYHCAGYFNIKLNGTWKTELSPKYIFIQRYEYQGPFTTETEATARLNTV